MVQTIYYLPLVLTPTERIHRHFVLLPLRRPTAETRNTLISLPYETGILLRSNRLLAPSLLARKPRHGRCAFLCCNPCIHLSLYRNNSLTTEVLDLTSLGFKLATDLLLTRVRRAVSTTNIFALFNTLKFKVMNKKMCLNYVAHAVFVAGHDS